jgi:hypothetical protein
VREVEGHVQTFSNLPIPTFLRNASFFRVGWPLFLKHCVPLATNKKHYKSGCRLRFHRRENLCSHEKDEMSMKLRIVFLDVLPCKIIVDRRLRRTCFLHHQGWVKRRSTIILHGSTSQKTILNFILAAVRTWNLTWNEQFRISHDEEISDLYGSASIGKICNRRMGVKHGLYNKVMKGEYNPAGYTKWDLKTNEEVL